MQVQGEMTHIEKFQKGIVWSWSDLSLGILGRAGTFKGTPQNA